MVIKSCEARQWDSMVSCLPHSLLLSCKSCSLISTVSLITLPLFDLKLIRCWASPLFQTALLLCQVLKAYHCLGCYQACLGDYPLMYHPIVYTNIARVLSRAHQSPITLMWASCHSWTVLSRLGRCGLRSLQFPSDLHYKGCKKCPDISGIARFCF